MKRPHPVHVIGEMPLICTTENRSEFVGKT